MPDRFPPIPPGQQTPEQQAAAAAVADGPRGGLRGPFQPLLHSPALLDRAQRLGEYLRYNSAIPEDLREFAILITARHWRQTYEWHVHAPLAEKTGLPAPAIAALAAGHAPTGLTPAQSTILDFCQTLHETGEIPDPLFARATDLLGEKGVIDLLGVCGYYAMLAMVLNVARTPVPGAPPNPFKERNEK